MLEFGATGSGCQNSTEGLGFGVWGRFLSAGFRLEVSGLSGLRDLNPNPNFQTLNPKP